MNSFYTFRLLMEVLHYLNLPTVTIFAFHITIMHSNNLWSSLLVAPAWMMVILKMVQFTSLKQPASATLPKCYSKNEKPINLCISAHTRYLHIYYQKILKSTNTYAESENDHMMISTYKQMQAYLNNKCYFRFGARLKEKKILFLLAVCGFLKALCLWKQTNANLSSLPLYNIIYTRGSTIYPFKNTYISYILA